jgi:asparagine synthase (glutamine-hydrolysing)
VTKTLAGQHPAELIAASMDEAGSDDPVVCAQYADVMTYLPGDILTKVDRCSMAVSLEVRAPLLDHELVEWAFTLPSSLKLVAGEGKYILKRALEPRVPRENLYRRKQGFATNLAAHFRRSGTHLTNAITRGPMADSGLFDLSAIGDVLRQHNSGSRDHSQALWSLLMFSGFLSQVHFGMSDKAEFGALRA